MLLGEREWKDERERESKKLSVGLDENKRKKISERRPCVEEEAFRIAWLLVYVSSL